ncbi:histone-lysine N-methyltransferase family member SUVH9-like protein [Tanacetum coccineum]
MRECTCGVIEKFMLRDSNSKLIQFLMKLNDECESVRSQVLAMDPLHSVNKAYYIVQQIEKQKQVTNHTFEPSAFFANMDNKGSNNERKENKGSRVYGKTAKKQGRMAANVTAGFDDHFSRDNPFDLNTENNIGMHQGGGFDQKVVVVVCQDVMKMFNEEGGESNASRDYASTSHTGSRCLYICKPIVDPISFSGSISDFHMSHLNSVLSTSLSKESFSNSVSKNGDCILTATYLINKILVKILDWKSPYESLYGKPPIYDHLRVIGFLCYAANVKPHKDKFENRGVKCVLIGYPVNQKGYKLYNWETKNVFLRRDMVFEEQVFPFKQLDNISNEQSCPTYPVFNTHPLEETVIPNIPLPETTPADHLDNNEPTVEHVEEPITRAPIPSHTFVPVRKSTRSSTRPAW